MCYLPVSKLSKLMYEVWSEKWKYLFFTHFLNKLSSNNNPAYLLQQLIDIYSYWPMFYYLLPYCHTVVIWCIKQLQAMKQQLT